MDPLRSWINQKDVEERSRLTAVFRFFFTIGLALLLSMFFDSPKLGGFSALGAFMALLSDTKETLDSRLQGLVITFFGVIGAAILGLFLKGMPYGVWLILGIACFGESLLSFATRFWWLWGKYCLVFLMVALFDFAPDKDAFIGYAIGFSLAAVVIVLDHYYWKIEQLGKRPLEELRAIEGGVHNSVGFAMIAALTLVVSLWIAKEIKLPEPAWVGITIIYLLNTDVAMGFKRMIARLIGTVAGYLFVVWLFPYAHDHLTLGLLIVFSSLGMPYFVGKNYAIMSFFITVYILFVLDWLLLAYGGDGRLLQWRLYDTFFGAACASVALSAMWVLYRLRPEQAKKQ